MASAGLDSRLRYLRAASRSMSRTAPATSAAIAAACTQSYLAHGVAMPESQSRENCAFCGNIFIPGRSCHVRIVPLDKGRRNLSKKQKQYLRNCGLNQRKDRVLSYSCLRCNREIKYPLEKPVPAIAVISASASTAIPSVAQPKPNTMASESRGPASLEPKASLNACSKARAKLRKNSGLQAMLAKNKTDAVSASVPGLDLLDFLKSG